jgi:hypothetical protein
VAREAEGFVAGADDFSEDGQVGEEFLGAAVDFALCLEPRVEASPEASAFPALLGPHYMSKYEVSTLQSFHLRPTLQLLVAS